MGIPIYKYNIYVYEKQFEDYKFKTPVNEAIY